MINKIDVAPFVEASLEVMAQDSRRMRGTRPFIFTNLKENAGVAEIVAFIEDKGGFSPHETVAAEGVSPSRG